MNGSLPCPDCSGTVRVPPEEVSKILKIIIETRHVEVADDVEYKKRMDICKECENLEFGTTCLYCGYLVEIRARILGEYCPKPGNRKW